MRWILDRATKKMVPADEYYANKTQSRIHLISDVMEPVKSMADGKMYDSKSRYRAELRARDMVEVGNERVESPTYEPPSAAKELAEALSN